MFRVIKQFPHCDPKVIHKPGDCTYCDQRSEWQELREAWGINFTGGTDPVKLTCPSELVRDVRSVHSWHGNRPTNVPVETSDRSLFDHVKRDDS